MVFPAPPPRLLVVFPSLAPLLLDTFLPPSRAARLRAWSPPHYHATQTSLNRRWAPKQAGNQGAARCPRSSARRHARRGRGGGRHPSGGFLLFPREAVLVRRGHPWTRFSLLVCVCFGGILSATNLFLHRRWRASRSRRAARIEAGYSQLEVRVAYFAPLL